MKKQHEGSLFDILDDTQELVRKSTGMNIKIPKPGKRILEVNSITNGIIGTSLVAFGLLTTHKWTMILGAVGIASSIIMNEESKRSK